jgi:hypothetical protein
MTLRTQIILSIALGLAAGFIGFCHLYPLMNVSGYLLEIDGEPVGTDARDLLADTMRTNFFRQPLGEYAQALLSEHPELASVKCRMNLKGEVICEGERKRPVAIVCLPEAYGLSSRGEILPLAPGDIMDGLPLVTGVKVPEIEPFAFVSSAELKEALKICDLLRSEYTRIGKAVSQIHFDADRPPVLHFRNTDVRVVIGYGNYRQKLLNLDLILDRLDRLPANELDLRFGRSIIARDLT